MAKGEFCEYCEQELTDRRAGTKTCDENCRKKLERKRKKEYSGNIIPDIKRTHPGYIPDVSVTKADISVTQTGHNPDISRTQTKNFFTQPQLKEDNNMEENTNGFNYYKARFEELVKSHDEYKTERKETETELRGIIKTQEAELKTSEKENNKLNQELAIIHDKHQLELQRTDVESSSTLGGFLKDAGKPENLETILGILGIVKEIRAEKKQGNTDASAPSSGDPQKDELIRNIQQALMMKDTEFIAKYFKILELAFKTNLLDQVLESIRKGQAEQTKV